jgi:superfamily II DNA/RNA helicase
MLGLLKNGRVPLLLSRFPVARSNSRATSQFAKLGLNQNLVDGLEHEHNITLPTNVQLDVIPHAINKENLVMAASTGSGKTLAFVLPVLQALAAQESIGYERIQQRPRSLILVPTRELAQQVLTTIKLLSHRSKVSSCAVLGGEQYGLQKKALNRLIDVVVASPGRLMKHKEQGHVFLSHVNHVVIDEVDTMMTQGFGKDIRAILNSVIANKTRQAEAANAIISVDADTDTDTASTSQIATQPEKLQLIMATATLTKAVRALLEDVEEGSFNIGGDSLKQKNNRVKLNVIEVSGVHRALDNVKHYTEDTKGADKMVTLKKILGQYEKKKFQTMIFCNSVNSSRAVQYALNENGIEATSYHGELNSRERTANIQDFRDGVQQYLVCTDLAARGLDIPEIDHVIIFDFPLNPIDYLHRSGRCGRMGRNGIVTSILQKRDRVLSGAIQAAIAKGLPLDSLTASKRDYQPGRKLGTVMMKAKSKKEKSWSKSKEAKKQEWLNSKPKAQGGVKFNSKPKVNTKTNANGNAKDASFFSQRKNKETRSTDRRVPQSKNRSSSRSR